jgi:glutamine synthetase
MVEQLAPTEPMSTSAWDRDFELPSHMEDSIRRMRECEPVREVFGGAFIDAFLAVKELEYATYNRVISSWEREHLLLLV